jgi:hypothetical protein
MAASDQNVGRNQNALPVLYRIHIFAIATFARVVKVRIVVLILVRPILFEHTRQALVSIACDSEPRALLPTGFFFMVVIPRRTAPSRQ